MQDILVLETAAVLAGPAVGMFFAELGARVIKIENKRAGGDVTRRWKLPSEDPASPVSAYFSSVNWGKEHRWLDLKDPTDRVVFDRTVHLINDFKGYFRKYDQPIYENPSPGNKKGGITTLEEKSLGCVQKGGAQPVVDVLTYAQPVTKPGLNLLQAPGNDLVAASALALSGCQLVLFTTGRGTPFGSFVPTMKISTNTQLAEFKAKGLIRLIEGDKRYRAIKSSMHFDELLPMVLQDYYKAKECPEQDIPIEMLKNPNTTYCAFLERRLAR